MRRELGRLGRCAAALQCIAEEFREFAAYDSAALNSRERDEELDRFAGLLDHMAATLMVPTSPPSAQVLRLAPPEERREPDRAAHHH